MKRILFTLVALATSASAYPTDAIDSIRNARQEVDVCTYILKEDLQAKPDYRLEQKAYAEWIKTIRYDERKLNDAIDFFVLHFPPPTFEYKP